MNGRIGMFLMISSLFLCALQGCASYGTCGSGGCSDDAKITQDVQARLDSMSDFGPPGAIRVATRDHVVYLNGTVDAGLAKHLAASVAKQTPGVARIVNSIAVDH
ncbi:MAG TPA: BON domain-containing protein [Steroidobacteraceae bacterium]|jgi:osmotically-inducible protein OsmY|nr:BON domain-containing protein [Steroidobacteraceae bacterium]